MSGAISKEAKSVYSKDNLNKLPASLRKSSGSAPTTLWFSRGLYVYIADSAKRKISLAESSMAVAENNC